MEVVFAFLLSNRVLILGLGYVGLTTGLGLASRGIRVTGVEIDERKLAEIKNGRVPFHEPQASQLLRELLDSGFFEARSSVVPADISFITVGTPSRKDGSMDLIYVESAAKAMGAFLRKHGSYHLIVVKSTVLPGTTEGVIKPIIESESGKKVGRDFGLAMNPEFLREGSALRDMYEPDRLVIGEHDNRSGDILASLYGEFYASNSPPVLRTNIVNAEFIKYASNAFLALKISYINTIANIAQRVQGADVETIARGIGLDQRISGKFLNAGLGYGGSCFPKDVRALIAFSKSVGYDPLLLEGTERINLAQAQSAIDLASQLLGDNLSGRVVTMLGLSFKPGTDDIREAVSARMLRSLLERGATVRAYDPAAAGNMSRVFPEDERMIYAISALDALKGSDCCFLVTEWDEFKKLEPDVFLGLMRTPVLIDGRRLYDAEAYSKKIRFAAIGLGPSETTAELPSKEKVVVDGDKQAGLAQSPWQI